MKLDKLIILDKSIIIDSLVSLVSVTFNPIDYIKKRGGTGLKPRDYRDFRRRERTAYRFVKKKL